MDNRRSTFLLLTASLFWVTLAAVGAWLYLGALKRVAPVVDSTSVSKVISDFNSKHQVLFKLEINDVWRNQLRSELYDASAIIPSPDRYNREQMIELLEKGKTCAPISMHGLSEPMLKLVKYFDHKCGRSGDLDPSVWRSPPLIHPLGGSWAYWLFEQGFGDRDWLVREAGYVHALERKHLPETADKDAFDQVFRRLAPADLERFVRGDAFFLGENFVIQLAFPSSREDRMHVFSRADWDKYMQASVIQAGPPGSEICDFKQDSLCWSVREDLRHPRHGFYLAWLLLAMCGLVATVIWTLWLRAREEASSKENQQIVMQTLTHELRYPVTGLNLSVETLRSNYDKFPEDVKTECVRLMALSARMNRLVNVSQQYLRLLAEDRQFVFKKDSIESFVGFLESVLEPYEGKLTVLGSKDVSCTIDGYWVGTCIVNLVKNALMHGQKPIEVSWKSEGDSLHITVSDAGPGPNTPLDDLVEPRIKKSLSTGMGLGLSLVNRLTRLMNGTLTMQTEPTRFTLTFRGVLHDQAAAG